MSMPEVCGRVTSEGTPTTWGFGPRTRRPVARPLNASSYPYTVLQAPALVAQRIEHLTTDQKVGGSSPFERAQLRA